MFHINTDIRNENFIIGGSINIKEEINKNILPESIITGERIQEIANVYFGNTLEDLYYNPKIKQEKHKHKLIKDINSEYDNPPICFCYTHCINNFNNIIHFFKNKFILISHNSDYNIVNNHIVNRILTYPKLIRWYSQNVCYDNNKLIPIPIGIANKQWLHGDLKYFEDNIDKDFKNKDKKVYLNFNINTNINARRKCINELKNKLTFLYNVEHYLNLKRLSEYEFSICPEGNGIDTHRLWESLYVKTIPIVLDNSFIQIIKKYLNPPMLILKEWKDLSYDMLDYSKYSFKECYDKITKEYYKSMIEKI